LDTKIIQTGQTADTGGTEHQSYGLTITITIATQRKYFYLLYLLGLTQKTIWNQTLQERLLILV
jgi:hypothetical protein